jgi:hypothetical protein
MRNLGIRSGLALACIVIYFLLLRPFRAEFNQYVYQPVVQQSIEQSDQLFEGGESSSVSSYLIWGDTIESGKDLHIKVPFGLHFLLAIIGLVLISAKRSFYLYLLGVQVGGSLMALFCLYLGSLTIVQLLIISDLLLRYLVPLCSLGMVPLAFIDQRKSIHER